MNGYRYFVAFGHPSWSEYEQHIFDTEEEVLAFRKKREWSGLPIRVIYGTEMMFEPVKVVEEYRLAPRSEIEGCLDASSAGGSEPLSS